MLLAIVASVSFASAASLSISNVNFPTSVNHDGGSFQVSFDITNNGAADPAVAFTLQMSQGTATLTMPTVPIGDGTTTPVTISVSGTVRYPAYQQGNLAGSIIADDQGGGSPKTIPFIVSVVNKPSIKISKITDLTQSRNGSIEIENNGNIDWSDVQLTSSGDFSVLFYDAGGNSITSLSLDAGDKETVTVSGVGLDNLGFGGGSTTITVTADDGTTKATFGLDVSGSFCKFGEVGGDLDIRNIKIYNDGQGKKDSWDLLDSLRIEVEIENTGNDKIKDIFVEMGLFDSDGKNVVSDLEFDNSDEEQADLGSLNDGDRDTITFTFQVPADFEDGTYDLTIKAYSDDVGEDEQCVDTSTDFSENDKYDSIDVNRQSDSGKYIAFDNVQFTPTEGTCGDSITMTLDAYNIGDEDQDQVRINLKNTELGINSFVEIRNGMDQGDKESVMFNFVIPADATDKFYNLELSADYDYRSGTYRLSSDTDTIAQYRIIGCGTTPGGSTGERIAIISADLVSDTVVAGGKVVVKATITNLKTQRTAFAVDALGYQSWATLDDISPRVVNLDAGQSAEVTFTFTIDEGIQGEESFNIEVKDGLGGSETREIALNVESASGSGTGVFNFGDNAFLWVIGAVNVILVVLIIVVAVRVARR